MLSREIARRRLKSSPDARPRFPQPRLVDVAIVVVVVVVVVVDVAVVNGFSRTVALALRAMKKGFPRENFGFLGATSECQQRAVAPLVPRVPRISYDSPPCFFFLSVCLSVCLSLSPSFPLLVTLASRWMNRKRGPAA